MDNESGDGTAVMSELQNIYNIHDHSFININNFPPLKPYQILSGNI